MAEKKKKTVPKKEPKIEPKTEPKTEPKEKTYTINGKEYTVMEETERSVKLTDGRIHFWRKKNVK